MKLVLHPNNCLDQSVSEFDFNGTYDPKQIEKEMIDIMIKNHGIGLSANQVALPFQVFTILPKHMSDVKEPFAIFNPKILAQDEIEVDDVEGCLSFPNLWLRVKRPKSVVAEFITGSGHKSIMRFSDYDAKCFLHEYDHLQGICFTKKVSKLKLDLATKRQRKLNGRTQ